MAAMEEDGKGEPAEGPEGTVHCFMLFQANWPTCKAFKNITQRLSVKEPDIANRTHAGSGEVVMW